MKNFQLPEHYNYLDGLKNDGFWGEKGSELMVRIMSEASGLETLSIDMSLPLNAEQWIYEPLRSESVELTCAWMHVPGHPFVLLLTAKGKPDREAANSFMRFEPSIANPPPCTA